jgi:hypothetical protein
MGDIEAAIMHGAEAGKLRAYVRKSGETGLAGLIRLADRHGVAATAALNRIGETVETASPAHRDAGGSRWGR